ncbi:uncharacterized protein LOC115097639 [Rhinatrema bivittatum]|uniref:uncharacterized protein LOC115097639 n=1 Tax=Rhinatrema bivittatum TaxID=194408 RepID=UPI00112DB2AF|nr:uncharacterized protein LOC115097639 [Rhinatrema bivittatum]
MECLDGSQSLEMECLNRSQSLEMKGLNRSQSLETECLDQSQSLEMECLDQSQSMKTEVRDRSQSLEMQCLNRRQSLETEVWDRSQSLEMECLNRSQSLETEVLDRSYSTDQSWEQENFTLTMRLPQTLLFSVLLCIAAVQSETPVLSPSILSVRLGQSATFTCDVGVKDVAATYFLSQIPGEAPKLLLYHHYSYSAPNYGPGISSAHFDCTVNSAGMEYQLLVKNAEVTGTALYYCLKWYPPITASHCDKAPVKNPD